MPDKIIVTDGTMEAVQEFFTVGAAIVVTAPLWLAAGAIILAPGIYLANFMHPAIATGSLYRGPVCSFSLP
jgi:hypothetical protein